MLFVSLEIPDGFNPAESSMSQVGNKITFDKKGEMK